MKGIRAIGAVCGLLLILAATAGAAPSIAPNIYTIAGIGVSGNSGDGGQATEAEIDQPRSMDAVSDGSYVWAEPYSYRVRMVGADGVITTLAGTGTAGYSGDNGPATDARLNFAHGVAQLTDGSYVIADTVNSVIRRVAPNGTITTIVGTGSAGYGGDGGPAVAATINNPRGIAAMSDGGFVFPDTNNHRVRRVWPDGSITTVAGIGVQGYSGDTGPAVAAQLSLPLFVAPTAGGGLLIDDVGNQRIRKVDSGGTITTVAGDGTAGYSGDNGPATSAELNNAHAVAAYADGSFLIADTSNLVVRKVASDGTITTFAGNNTLGSGGDGGPATSASISYPKGVDIDASGGVLVADEQGNRIRFIGTPVMPANISPPVVSGTTQQGRVLTTTTGRWSGTGPTFTYQWLRCDTSGGNCGDITNANAKTYTLTLADVGWTLRMRVTAGNAAGSANATSLQTSVVTGGTTAVTLASFSAVERNGRVLLRWRTAREADLLGFELYRSADRSRIKLNKRLIQSVRGTAGHRYAWIDRRAPGTATRYWLRTVGIHDSAWFGPAVLH